MFFLAVTGTFNHSAVHAEEAFVPVSETEQTITEAPVAQEPVTEVPTPAEVVTEAPVFEEPIAEVPVAEEPVIEEPEISPEAAAYGVMACEIVEQINAYRVSAGLRPLDWNAGLFQAAAVRAAECDIQWSHVRPDGTPFYTADENLVYGENLAKGFNSSIGITSAFAASPTHYSVMTSPEFNSIGLAFYVNPAGTVYCAVEFGL